MSNRRLLTLILLLVLVGMAGCVRPKLTVQQRQKRWMDGVKRWERPRLIGGWYLIEDETP